MHSIMLKKVDNFIYLLFRLIIYSAFNDSTGSFLLAILAGASPEITVNNTLIQIKIKAWIIEKLIIFLILPKLSTIKLIPLDNTKLTTIPKVPANKPSIIVSAVNTLLTSFLLAPIALKIPISFVLSNTEIYVIIPIIIAETTNEIETKAIITYDIKETIDERTPVNDAISSSYFTFLSFSTPALYLSMNLVIFSLDSNLLG